MANPDSVPLSASSSELDQDGHPSQIAGYEILGLLGEGGMGRVYRARERHPPREVALKLVRGLDRGALARFRREAELLASLEHAGIARLYASGEADFAGLRLPWLAMEYVRGVDLLRYAEREDLDLSRRVRLLIEVCRAVHFAHGRGVIHRDLKPGNIVVGDDGHPRVLDFGIARLRDDADGMTQQGQVLGTVPYMSPEQLAGRSHDVDTRCDVYALGVIAYELIARRLPHPRLSTSTALEALEIVRRETPPRLASLAPKARGDLDLVVMKALASEASRRYSSVAEFAADLERVLDHRPVEARAPTVAYFISRFVRRHRALSLAAGVVLAVLVGATVVSLRYAVAEAAARQEAELRAAEAQSMVAFLQTMLASADPENALGREMRVFDVLEQARRDLDGSDLPAAVAARLTHVLGKTYLNLGEIETGVSLMQQLAREDSAVEDLRHEAEVDLAMADNARGDYPAALARVDALLAANAELTPEVRVYARIARAHSLAMSGKLDDAVGALKPLVSDAAELLGPDHRHSLTARHNLAVTLQEQGRFDEAAAESEAVLARRVALFGDEHPETLYSRNQLAALYHRMGRSEEAELQIRSTIEARSKVLGPRHPATLTSRRNLAVMMVQTGRLDEGLAELQALAADWEASRGADAPQTLSVLQLVAYVLQDLKRFDDAERVLRRVVDVQVAQGGPKEPLLLAPRNDLGMVLMELGRPAEAIVEFDGLMAWAEAMLDADDVYLAIFRSNRGDCLNRLQRWDEARSSLEASRPVLLQTFGAQHARSRTVSERLLASYRGLGLRAEADALAAELTPPPT